jgi:hypothetical protein
MKDGPFLHAVSRYAEYGDSGARNYLGRTEPFGKWGRRAEANRALSDEDLPPEEFVEELSEALGRLQPVEREALREALKRSV